MARTWTPAQQSAIEEINKTLLVSAAAGSGKTAVLSERIVRALIDEEHPVDITRMLIVTFTRTAAAEMRSRIADELNKRAGKSRNPHIARQLLLLPGAYICTIDSFCLDLVRAHAASLGISPAFRPADQAENLLLLHSVLDRLVEECYGGTAGLCTDAEFCSLVDCLTGGRDDSGLAGAILQLYEKTRGFAGTYNTLFSMAKELCDAVACEPFSTPWGACLREETGDAVRAAMQGVDRQLIEIAEDESAEKAFHSALTSDLAELAALANALELGYAETREKVCNFNRASIGKLSAAEKTEISEAARSFRDKFYKFVAKMKQQYAYSPEELKVCLGALADKVELLARLLEEFDRRVTEEKRRRSICDFGDIEHFALRLLTDSEGNPTPLAHEVRRSFDWVYIDEYQDVNEVQHRIFEAVSQERNRFMVGDVKQSIYGFRGAQPEIFASVRRAYKSLSAAAEEDTAATVSLSANFRSMPNILAFANLIFGRLMEGVGNKIDYRPSEDELIPGRGTTPAGAEVEVVFFEKTPKDGGEDAETPESENDEEETEDREEEENATPDAEAIWVAKKIEELLRDSADDEKPLRPCDIAILASSNAPLVRFAAALDTVGIRSELSVKRGFFLNPEVLLALSLLNTVDNPRRDIHLAGVLRSPIYRFTMDDLIAIRTEAQATPEYKDCTLYEALDFYAACHPGGKESRFLAELAELRRMAESMPVDRLIWHIYQKTGLLTLAGNDSKGNPEARRANLMMLYDHARKYEASSYHGLYSFIAYINEAIERGQSIEEPGKMSANPDSVCLASIHQSKGLEWRVCFVVDCSHGFNLRDTTAPLLFDRTLGCALRLRDESGFARLDNPVYNAVRSSTKDAAVEEQTRVLYVALTRPKERLFVTGAVASDRLKDWEEGTLPLSATAVHGCKSYADMLLLSMQKHPSYSFKIMPLSDVSGTPCVVKEEKTVEKDLTDRTEEDTLCDLFARRFGFVYADAYLGELPSKMSVSRLYPDVLDVGEENVAEIKAPEEVEFTPVRPRFLDGEKADAADKGTATHLFMQFCDFARLAEEGGESELARLVEGGFIPKEKADLVRLDEIEAFRRSDFLSLLLSGGKLYRELRFNVRLPASNFTEIPEKKEAYSEETLLVQGVMDGVLVGEDGSITLFDYKTDRLSYAEKKNRALAEKKLLDRHRLQLGYYIAACRHIFGKNPDRVTIYSLALGDTVDLPSEEFGESLKI